MTDPKTIKELWAAAAQNLCGRPVIVRWRHPVSDKAAGEAYKLGNQAVVDLSDD